MGILKGYVNKENNSNRIYSREDVGKMSTAEYSKNEKAIDHQMRTVGVPTNNDLKNSSDVVYVSAYKRADGTEVSAYYRSKPDGIGSSSTPGVLVPNTNPPTGGDLVPDGTENPIDKILNFLKGDYTGESILPTDGESPLEKMGSGDIVSQILNMIAGGNTGGSNDENILQKILGGATTDGNNNDIVSTLLSVLSGGSSGDLGKIPTPDGNGGIWDEKIPQDGTEGSTIPDLSSMTNPISAILDYINTGEFDINKLLPTPNNDGEIIDENPKYPWETQDDKEDKKSKKDKDEEEKNKVNPLADLLNYVFTGEFNKDEFVEHTVRSVMDNDILGAEQENDPNREALLNMIKKSNEQINEILDGITNLLPEDSQVTGVVKGLVQYAKSAGQQLETMLDPEKMQEQMIQEVSQYVSDFTDFTGQLLSGDFENIDWAEVGQKLHVSQIASLINPVAGVIATLAVDVAPKVVKLVEGINSGDKAEIIQNAIGAFTNCMGVIGQLKSAVGNKLAEFSKDVDAQIYDEATQTYQNLEQIQDAGYKYETYVKAEMFDQANQEALKLNDLSTDMMQGKATGYATNIDSIDVDAITNDNLALPDKVFELSATKTEYPDVNTEVPKVQNSQTTDFGDSAIIASQISNAINSIMNNSQNASNLNVSDAPQFRASSNNLNTSIEAIKKAQTVQKNNLDTLLQRLTTTKNQEEYSKLLKEYAQQKEKYQKTQDLTAQIEHSVQKGKSQGIEQTAKNYMQQSSNTQPANQKLTREHYNNKLETLINNTLGIQSSSAEEMPTQIQANQNNMAKNRATGFASDIFDKNSNLSKIAPLSQEFNSTAELNAKADEFKDLSNLSDSFTRQGKSAIGAQAGDGWTVKEVMYNEKSNFKAVVYEKGDELVISYVGTDFKNIKDNAANLKMVLTGSNTQMGQANEFCKKIKDANLDKDITIIGHSEGGSEAIFAGAHNNLPVITYNAYGVKDNVLPKGFNPKNIYEYKAENDIVSKARKTKGDNVMVVPSEQSFIKSKTPIGWTDAHRIPTMGDINKAIPELQYRDENPSFLNVNDLKNLNLQKLKGSKLHNIIIQRMMQDGVFKKKLSNNDLVNIYTMYLLRS